jgi:DNA polymerase I-like protein with 3'-5' exonuclease and polymerase domains
VAELIKAGLSDFFHNHVMRLQPHLARMNVGGILCDVAYKTHVNSQLEAQLEKQLEDFHRAVIRATGDPEYRPNPLSSTQVGELLFKRLKLVGRGGSTDERNRTRIMPTRELEKKAIRPQHPQRLQGSTQVQLYIRTISG